MVDRETRRELEALGYIGGTLSAQGGPRPDPRSQRSLMPLLREASQAINTGQLERAISVLDKVLAVNPGMALAWEQKGLAQQRLGRVPEAIESLQRALELSLGAPHVALEVARLMARSGRFGEAEELAVSAVDWDPVGAHSLLARLDLSRNRPEEALRHAEAAVAASDGAPDSLVLLAQVQLVRGHPQEALAVTDRVLAGVSSSGASSSSAPVAGLHRVRGNAWAQLGRPVEAEAELRSEIEGFPEDPRAYARLSVLLAAVGRASEVEPLLASLLERDPSAPAYAAAIRSLMTIGDREAAERLLEQAQVTLPDPRILARLLSSGPPPG